MGDRIKFNIEGRKDLYTKKQEAKNRDYLAAP